MKRVLNIFKNIGIVILAMFVGNLAMIGLLELGHSFFGDLDGFDPTAPYSERAAAVSTYLEAHPFAVYWIFFEHAMGAFVGVYIATFLSKPRRIFRKGFERRTLIAPAIVALLYVLGTVTNDLVTVPMSINWSALDLLLVVLFCVLAFLLGGGFKKQSSLDAVTSEEETYRG